jgi:hypothetical protein
MEPLIIPLPFERRAALEAYRAAAGLASIEVAALSLIEAGLRATEQLDPSQMLFVTRVDGTEADADFLTG